MSVPLDQLESSNTPTIATVPDKLSMADAQNLGQSSPIQYTEPKPPPDLLQRGEEDVQKPFIQMQHTVGASMYWLGDNLRDETPFGDLGSRVARAGIIMQERSIATLKDKFSNFTPNMLDDIVGAVPTLAGFIGAGFAAGAAGIPAGVTAGAVATAGGLGIASEEFNKLKMQGKSTAQGDALALDIGVPVGVAMAAGFGVVGKLVEPWFTSMLGATIAKVVGDKAAMLTTKVVGGAAAGASAFGAQAGVQDTGEMLTGIERKDAMKVLTDVTHNAIMGGVLGGGLGVSYALAQHAKLVDGMIKLGFKPQEAQQKATAILGQGAHVLMDKIEQHLDYTKDENARVQAPPAKGEVQPNVLERSGIPESPDTQFSSVSTLKEPEPDQSVIDLSKDFKYVKLRPLNISAKLSGKDPALEVRQKYLGAEMQQHLENSHLHTDLIKEIEQENDGVPAPLKQQTIFRSDIDPEFFKLALKDSEAGALQLLEERNKLFDLKKDPSEDEIQEVAEKLESMRPVMELALNPTPAMKSVMAKGKQYYDEQGAISQAMGTINEIRENYHSSRLYKSDPMGDLKKNLRSTNKKFSAHSLERIYPNSWVALANGAEYKTENFADALYHHAEEMTSVNYSRQLQNALSEKKPIPLASWVREGALPPAWEQIGTSKKVVKMRDPKTGEMVLDEEGNQKHYYAIFAAPKALASGLKPITDPNYRKLLFEYNTLDKIQGFAKTGLLSLSFFHHYTFMNQTLSSYQGLKTWAELPGALKNDVMSEPGFRDLEKRFVKYGGTTQETHNIQDIWADMNKGEDAFSKILQKPFIKQYVDVVDANSDLLFKGIQRYIKTMTFSRNMAKWEGEHPNASQKEIDKAAYGYAQGTNDNFGGQNWQLLGVTREKVALMRQALLAPDWVVSNIRRTTTMFSKWSNTTGSQARWQMASGILGGLVANEMLNYIRTGHFSDQNKKGHEWDAEVSPDVYVNNIRGGPGELLKAMSDALESEGGPGFFRYAQGKAAPLASSVIRAASNTTNTGANIWKSPIRHPNGLEENVNGFWNVVAPTLGIPIGVTGTIDYAMREQDKSLLGFSLVASGLGRFSKSGGSGGRRR